MRFTNKTHKLVLHFTPKGWQFESHLDDMHDEPVRFQNSYWEVLQALTQGMTARDNTIPSYFRIKLSFRKNCKDFFRLSCDYEFAKNAPKIYSDKGMELVKIIQNEIMKEDDK